LKPTGNTVGDVGDQLPSLGGDQQTLSLLAGNGSGSRSAGGDLAVSWWQGTVIRTPLRPAADCAGPDAPCRGTCLVQVFIGLRATSGPGHVKRQRRWRHTFGDDPNLAPARSGVGGHRDSAKTSSMWDTRPGCARPRANILWNPLDQVLLRDFFSRTFRSCWWGPSSPASPLWVSPASHCSCCRRWRPTGSAARKRDRSGPGPREVQRVREFVSGHFGGHDIIHVVSFFCNWFSCCRSNPSSSLLITR